MLPFLAVLFSYGNGFSSLITGKFKNCHIKHLLILYHGLWQATAYRHCLPKPIR